MAARKAPGLTLRGEIWHITKTVIVGREKRIIRESTGTSSLREATRILEFRISEVRSEILSPTVEAATEHTFNEAAVEYILELERRGKSPVRAMQDIKLVESTIGTLPLSHIHQKTIEPWIDSLKGKLASSTVDRAIRTTTTILNYAARVLRDDKTHEPWLKQAPPLLKSPDWGSRRPVHLTWLQQEALLDALPEHLAAPVAFALATGARQNEIVTLRWDKHHASEQMPKWSAFWIPPEVRKANSRKLASEQDGRFLICNARAREIVEGQVGKSKVWVFPSPRRIGDDRDHPLYRINNNGWRAACRKAGVTLRVHDLRHTFGSRAADAGIPLDVRRSLLGHEHKDITLHYSSPGLVRLLQEAETIK